MASPISAAFKDLPGSQILGPTFDYTHRLLNFALAAEDQQPEPALTADAASMEEVPSVVGLLDR